MIRRPTLEIAAVDTPEEPTYRAREPDPCVLVIFGVTGDLSRRKLVPALYQLARNGALPESFAVVGTSRSARSKDVLQDRLRQSLGDHSRTGTVDESVWRDFASRLEVVAGSATEPSTYDALKETLAEVEARYGTSANRLYYLAVSPSLFAPILQRLQAADLIRPAGRGAPERPWSRVIIEKPFGHDLASAQKLNDLVAEVLHERQTYRIDHYLGKETVQNILVMRFANAIFEPIWNRKYVDHIQVTAAEEIGVTGRGAFYDETGVLRDIVQNHLLQVLALSIMEPPVSFAADDIRDEKLQAIRSLAPIDPRTEVVRGQYVGYEEVEGVAEGSDTATFTAMKILVDNWRWQGVPIYLRAGKALPAKRTQVSIHFRPVPFCVFGDACAYLRPNVLNIRIQPNEGINLSMASKVPGDDLSIGGVEMDFSYATAFQKKPGDAYERLLLDAMRGDATLFARRDEVEQAWRYIEPILEHWENSDEPVERYAQGSNGPDGAHRLIRRDGRMWGPI